jgi:hypothetical protein
MLQKTMPFPCTQISVQKMVSECVLHLSVNLGSQKIGPSIPSYTQSVPRTKILTGFTHVSTNSCKRMEYQISWGSVQAAF